MHTFKCAVLITLVAATPAFAQTGQAILQPTTDDSPVSGQATFTDTPEGLDIVVDVSGASPGVHGLHIHQFGRCDDGGNAAGGHYNPDQVPHGFAPKDGFDHAHPGDLGNITVNASGIGHLELTVPGLTLIEGDYPIAGRGLVLHEKADDFGQPTGNAGGRLGCGPIVITSE